jgi:hypothetical protein
LLFILYFVIIGMTRWSITRAYYEARHLQISLHFTVVLELRVVKSKPLSIEFVVQVSIHGRETNAELSNEGILKNRVVIENLQDQLECFQLILIHHQSGKGK